MTTTREFLFLSGRPAVDLCNTRLGDRDLLIRPDDLANWFVVAGVTDRPPAISPGDVAAARRVLLGEKAERAAVLVYPIRRVPDGRNIVRAWLRATAVPEADWPRIEAELLDRTVYLPSSGSAYLAVEMLLTERHLCLRYQGAHRAKELLAKLAQHVEDAREQLRGAIGGPETDALRGRLDALRADYASGADLAALGERLAAVEREFVEAFARVPLAGPLGTSGLAYGKLKLIQVMNEGPGALLATALRDAQRQQVLSEVLSGLHLSLTGLQYANMVEVLVHEVGHLLQPVVGADANSFGKYKALGEGITELFSKELRPVSLGMAGPYQEGLLCSYPDAVGFVEVLREQAAGQGPEHRQAIDKALQEFQKGNYRPVEEIVETLLSDSPEVLALLEAKEPDWQAIFAEIGR